MKFYIIASGSKGNATLVADHDRVLLIDMGITLKKLKEGLASTPYGFESIDAVLFTHDHSDHLAGKDFFPLEKRYAAKGTCDVLPEHELEVFTSYEIQGFKVTVLPTSHDAVNPVGFVFEKRDEKLVYMTDTGYISERNMAYMKNADYYIIESNHNIKMLLRTNRPYDLIQRILGDYGHLSNEDSAMYVSEMIGEKTREVVLAHLSEEANTPEVALATYFRIFRKRLIDIDRINIHAASQHQLVVGGNFED